MSSEALRLAHELILAMRDTDEEHWDTLEEAAAKLRRLHAENQALREANEAFSKRQEWWNEKMVALEAINAELREALRRCRDMVAHPDNLAFIDAALAKVEASNGS